MVTSTRLDATQYFKTRPTYAPKKVVFTLTESGIAGKQLKIEAENQFAKGVVVFGPVMDILAPPHYLFWTIVGSTGEYLGHDNTWQKSIDMP